MTTAAEPPAARAGPARAPGPPVAPGQPAVLVSCAQAGAAQLATALESCSGLACSRGLNLPQLCRRMLQAWYGVEAQAGGPSALAQRSIRSAVAALGTALLAGRGRAAWCDIAPGGASAAGHFLRLYPQARIICLHRNFPDVAASCLRAWPGGLPPAEFGPFLVRHAASEPAALGDCWATQTELMIGVQRARPGQCLRVRYEDFAADPARVAGQITAFLGLPPPAVAGRPGAGLPGGMVSPAGTGRADGTDLPGETSRAPLAAIPGPLRARIDGLHAELGYPPAWPVPGAQPGRRDFLAGPRDVRAGSGVLGDEDQLGDQEG